MDKILRAVLKLPGIHSKLEAGLTRSKVNSILIDANVSKFEEDPFEFKSCVDDAIESLNDDELSTIVEEKMNTLLALENKPDAVYIASDYAALGALQVLNERKINIPNEIALVGFGNEPFTSMVTPTITSINQNSDEIGKKAAEAFLAHVKKDSINQSLNKIILNAELIVRDSSNREKQS